MRTVLNKGLCFAFIVSFSLALTPIDPPPSKNIDPSCQKKCDSSFGACLGESNGVKAFSNCSNKCSNDTDPDVVIKKDVTGLPQDIYTGMKWQCVEYARRFLAFVKEVIFLSVGSAFQIFDHTIVQSIYNPNLNYEFLSFPNGSLTPPQEGDLIIYSKSLENKYGHVAVIAEVDLNAGLVAVAEQNERNKPWENPNKYARKIKLIKCNTNEYVLIDTEVKKGDTCLFKTNIRGWKRVTSTPTDLSNHTIMSEPQSVQKDSLEYID